MRRQQQLFTHRRPYIFNDHSQAFSHDNSTYFLFIHSRVYLHTICIVSLCLPSPSQQFSGGSLSLSTLLSYANVPLSYMYLKTKLLDCLKSVQIEKQYWRAYAAMPSLCSRARPSTCMLSGPAQVLIGSGFTSHHCPIIWLV